MIGCVAINVLNQVCWVVILSHVAHDTGFCLLLFEAAYCRRDLSQAFSSGWVSGDFEQGSGAR